MATPSQVLMQCKLCGASTDTFHKTRKRLCDPCGRGKMVEAQRRYRERQKALCRPVECAECGKTYDTSQTNGKVWRCPKCLYEYHRKYRQSNLAKDAEYGRNYRARQGDSYRDKTRQRRWDLMASMTPEELAEFRKAEIAKTKRLHSAMKEEVFHAYGGWICNCCGVTEKAFLTIDHVNNDGSDMRRRGVHGKSSSQFYRWLKNNGYPSGFQVLCLNCNLGKHLNKGVCPHQESV